MAQPGIPTAGEIMTRALITLSPSMPARDAAKVLLRHSISGAPVLDVSGRLVGMLSELDCLRVVAVSGYERSAYDLCETVGELMSPSVHTVSRDLDVFGLAQEFMRLGTRRLPVIEKGRLVGQVSRRDTLRAVLRMREQRASGRRYPDYPSGREPITHYPRRR